MNRLAPLLLLSLVSSTLAAPLFGSKQSFAESNFCKKYRCVHVGTQAGSGNAAGAKAFNYRLPDGAEIVVDRSASDNKIFTVIVSYHGAALDSAISKGKLAVPYLKDLITSVTGVPGTFDLYGECVQTFDSGTVNAGSSHLFGKVSVGCISASGAVAPLPALVIGFNPRN